ncbi:MAG: hypothetical protein KGL39_39405 [Patescibacteria group bacterium]|nr:hypothetical protein [Patescibacteria group bacterium]
MPTPPSKIRKRRYEQLEETFEKLTRTWYDLNNSIPAEFAQMRKKDLISLRKDARELQKKAARFCEATVRLVGACEKVIAYRKEHKVRSAKNKRA